MQKILIISDTHSFLDERLMEHVDWCDQIWHGGDWGNVSLSDTLEAIKPIEGVYGNIDDMTVRQIYPKIHHFLCEDLIVGMTHIAGTPSKYKPDALECFKIQEPDIFICGHSHILKVQFDKKYNLLHMNPGAAGIYGFHQIRTMLRFEIDGDKIQKLEIIELGNRG